MDPDPDDRSRSEDGVTVDPFRIVGALALLGCLPTVLALGARWQWWLELFTHWRVYYAVVLLPLAGLLLLGRRYRLALLPAVIGLYNVGLVIPFYLGAPDVPRGEPTLRALTVNVQTENEQYDRLLSVVLDEDPDVVLLLEVDDAWMDALSPLEVRYPHSIVRSRPDNFGIAIFSRLPADTLFLGTVGGVPVPMVHARLSSGEGRFTLLGVHTLPPTRSYYAVRRNAQLRGLEDLVADVSGPLLVIGDLNATPWSPHVRDLLEGTRLRDARKGFGIAPTWAPSPGLLHLPLDHVLVSPDVAVHDFRVGADIGSDHRPVVVDFTIDEPPDPARRGENPPVGPGDEMTEPEDRTAGFRSRVTASEDAAGRLSYGAHSQRPRRRRPGDGA